MPNYDKNDETQSVDDIGKLQMGLPEVHTNSCDDIYFLLTASPSSRAISLCSLQQGTSDNAFQSSWLKPPLPSNETQKTVLQLLLKSPGRKSKVSREGSTYGQLPNWQFLIAIAKCGE